MVIYCHTCRTDLRPKNLDFHRDECGHDVKFYDHDPRDERFKAKEVKEKEAVR